MTTRRRTPRQTAGAFAAGLLTLALGTTAATAAEEKVLNVYNWSDYVAEDTISNFEQQSGIKVNYDVYDSQDVLESKLLAGRSGYDIVGPTLAPYAARQLAAGIYQKLDPSKIPNLANLDPKLMERVAKYDKDNAHLVPYMWGTTGIGYNVKMVKERLGEDGPLDSWRLLFDPEVVAKLADCGVSVMDSPDETFPAMLNYLGLDPDGHKVDEVDKVAEGYMKVRPFIRKFHNSQYINDLANGEVCVAMGYSGDVLQARDRAAEAENGHEIAYLIPAEGAQLWFDMLAIPVDAPHPENAHAFINYVLEPKVTAAISDYVAYANANAKATELVSEDVRNDPGIYPTAETMDRLWVVTPHDLKYERARSRAWTRIRSGTEG
ncbi:putrescine-binding periplasmic protein [Tistrella bauzanensis]|uniref:Putrescine-binding periplasmic protein n=1 Tax=Tistrella bauzanensis TaxID=657419 RepID=A0ABQ1IGH5_9PROT|nr:polyamine ABC transporter substrate-binding protein [Tistrella bauzanensis]GGB38077.1 putrescine-binding periplasmic protein [Tistrella bauzanensis]